MTKEELRKKYHGQVVQVLFPIDFGSFNSNQEVAAKTNILQNGCKELGLEVNEFQIANYGDSVRQSRMFQVTDKAQPILGDKPKSPIAVEEFLEDFKHYRNSFSIAGRDKAKRLLDEFKIEYGSIEKKHESCTSTDMVDEGFIQGYTSNEASLWWHPLGRRVFFVRGEGAFELTDKVEPKEEAHV